MLAMHLWILSFLILLPSLLLGQIKINNLFFNSPQNIVKLNFSTGEHEINYTFKNSGQPMGNSEGIAHVEDKDGNLIIWVNANGVYDKNGILMPGSNGILAHPSSTEIVICPFPSDTSKFYIIYNSQLCSKLYFSVVNMKLRDGSGDVETINTSIDANNNFAEGLEVIRIPCSNDYWLLTYQCEIGFKRFKIDKNGIHSPTSLAPYLTNNHGGRGELDYHNGKMGYAVTFSNKAFFANFNPLDGSLSNIQEVSFNAINGMYGLEFSPDASKVFVTDWDNRDFLGNFSAPNLFRYDFTTSLVASYTIDNIGALCGSTDVRGLGQIELAKNGNLYIPHIGGCQISIIENADSLNPQFSLLDVNTILSAGVSDHIQSELFERLTTNGDQQICSGDSVFMQVKGGNTYEWSPTVFLSDPFSDKTYTKPDASTKYTVYSENIYGCKDSASVNIKVTASPNVYIGPDTTLCENQFITLQAGNPGAVYQWSEGSTSNEIIVTQPDTYWLNVIINKCTSSDTIRVSKKEKISVFVPNLITPNGDFLNDHLEITGVPDKLILSVYNRWGKQIYKSDDYQNSWGGDSINDGIYFYILSNDQGCIQEKQGWIHIIGN